MAKKTPKKDIDDLEDTVKDLLGSISDVDPSNQAELDSQLDDLESVVKGALSELTELESNLLEIISGGGLDKAGNYLMAVRRFQNAMKIALEEGASKRDLNMFEEGFKFYSLALEIVNATGNQAEIDQLKSEFGQTLIKIMTQEENANDPDFKPFALLACIRLGAFYDSFEQFGTGLEFHNRAGDLSEENPLLANLEYFQVFLDHLILRETQDARRAYTKIELRQYKSMADEIIKAINEEETEPVMQVKTKLEVLAAQRNLDSKNTMYLLDLIKNTVVVQVAPVVAEVIRVPREAVALSKDRIDAIKASLLQSIQQLKLGYQNVQVPVTAQINTEEIVSEIKAAISAEISKEIGKEIRSLSNDIVSKILSSIPKGSMSAPAPRSAGHISDEGAPEIAVLETAPGEKPKRPKLDDMLNSIIVSE